LFNVSSEHDINGEEVWCSCFNESTIDFAFPNTFYPLADAFKGTNVLKKGVDLRRLESESNNFVFVAKHLVLWLVAIKVLVIFGCIEFIGACFFHFLIYQSAVGHADLADSVLLSQVRVINYFGCIFISKELKDNSRSDSFFLLGVVKQLKRFFVSLFKFV
jgi:hypothetical protein